MSSPPKSVSLPAAPAAAAAASAPAPAPEPTLEEKLELAAQEEADAEAAAAAGPANELQAQGAAFPLGEKAEWKGKAVPSFDKNMRAAMQSTQRTAAKNHPGAVNASASLAHPTALAPRNGFFDRRYECTTKDLDDIEDEQDFAFMRGDEILSEDGEPVPPKTVTLAMKNLTDMHIHWLSKYLAEQDSGEGCTKLWLNDNKITEDGAEDLAKALERNKTLEELYLHYTDIGDKGLEFLLNALAPGKNATLRRLECGCCGITQVGANLVKDRLGKKKISGSLEHIGLFGNDDSIDDDLHEINLQLRDNRKAAGRSSRSFR